MHHVAQMWCTDVDVQSVDAGEGSATEWQASREGGLPLEAPSERDIKLEVGKLVCIPVSLRNNEFCRTWLVFECFRDERAALFQFNS